MRASAGEMISRDEPDSHAISRFAYRASEQAELTIRHLSLRPSQETALLPSTLDEAGLVILHLGSADRFRVRASTGQIWSGRRMPGAVNLIAGRHAVTLATSHDLEVLVIGMPQLRLAEDVPEASHAAADRRAEAADTVGLGLGHAFLASFDAATGVHPPSTAHLARALCHHFARRHAWMQDAFARALDSGLAPWQARTAARLLARADVPVREVAAACRLSPSAFSRSFRVSFLRSPYEWRVERRMDAVKALLLAHEVSLSDAALQAGFSDQASMSRAFRRSVGDSPGAWRARQREA